MRDLIAAQHAPGGLPWWAWLWLFLIVLAAVKVVQWWWRPFGHCWCCKGRGRHYRKDGKAFRDCHWCRGSGRRLRIGRRVWNRFAKLRKASV